MALTKKYLGQTKEVSQTNFNLKQTYQGTQSEVDAFIIDNSALIGTTVSGKGVLNSLKKSQADGPIFQVEVQYIKTYNADGTQQELYGSKSQVLSVRMLSLPLSKSENYLTKWEYYLIHLGTSQDTLSGAILRLYNTAKDTFLQGYSDQYKWVKDISEIPTGIQQGKYWSICSYDLSGTLTPCQPTKAGVQNFDFAVYTITEKAKYRSKTSATTALNKRLNKISDTPPEGDMGLGNIVENWKCDDSSISYNGNGWVVQQSYTGSPTGWDQDLYQRA